DQLLELRRSGDVRAFADIDEACDSHAGSASPFTCSRDSNISSPERRNAVALAGIFRGGLPATASAMARICSGVVPQHPPTILTRPASAHSRRGLAVSSGVSS